MGHTASVYANRLTVCVTSQQRDFIFAGMRRHQIGMSEYMRRLLDRLMDTAVAAENQKREVR